MLLIEKHQTLVVELSESSKGLSVHWNRLRFCALGQPNDLASFHGCFCLHLSQQTHLLYTVGYPGMRHAKQCCANIWVPRQSLFLPLSSGITNISVSRSAASHVLQPQAKILDTSPTAEYSNRQLKQQAENWAYIQHFPSCNGEGVCGCFFLLVTRGITLTVYTTLHPQHTHTHTHMGGSPTMIFFWQTFWELKHISNYLCYVTLSTHLGKKIMVQ